MNNLKKIVDILDADKKISHSDAVLLLENHNNNELREYIFEKANRIREQHFKKTVYIRGLIEFSNHCKNNCYYCGIRRDNKNVNRYRLTKEEIYACCDEGYKLGFRTFVMQGGEDMYFTDDLMCEIISNIKNQYPDCAITLSMGEKSYESYKRFFDSGATRYLLRHETYNKCHYNKLHPDNMSIENRIKCLQNLKEIGYQTGCGFMVGSPYQTYNEIAEDILFINDFKPHMIGIGPFIPHADTPFCDFKPGTVALTTFILALLRISNERALIPSTTALGSVSDRGRIEGLLAGANVVMPNLSPINYRKDYSLYNNKAYSGSESAEGKLILEKEVEKAGFKIVVDKGDY